MIKKLFSPYNLLLALMVLSYAGLALFKVDALAIVYMLASLLGLGIAVFHVVQALRGHYKSRDKT